MAGSTAAATQHQQCQPGGNLPAAYDYTPNTFQLDQAVVYVERLPDTVQNDHFDWGFRFSALVWRELSLYHRLRLAAISC